MLEIARLRFTGNLKVEDHEYEVKMIRIFPTEKKVTFCARSTFKTEEFADLRFPKAFIFIFLFLDYGPGQIV